MALELDILPPLFACQATPLVAQRAAASGHGRETAELPHGLRLRHFQGALGDAISAGDRLESPALAPVQVVVRLTPAGTVAGAGPVVAPRARFAVDAQALVVD